MNPAHSNDRADTTVWLPLLQILGGVAERVSRKQPETVRPENEKVAGSEPATSGEAA